MTASNYPLIYVMLGQGNPRSLSAMPWTDISQWCQSGSSTMGTQHELGQVQAASCTLLLDNRDSRFTPWNTKSPYASIGNGLVPENTIAVYGTDGTVNQLYLDDSQFTNASGAASLGAWQGLVNVASLASSSTSLAAYSMQVNATAVGLTTADTNGYMANAGVIKSPAYSTIAGKTFTMSAYFKSTNATGDPCYVSIMWYDRGGNLISTSNGTPVNAPSASWTRASVTAVAPNNAAYVTLSVSCTISSSVNKYFYVDNAQYEANTFTVPPGSLVAANPTGPSTWVAGGVTGIQPLFFGYVDSWVPNYPDINSTDMTVTCTDIFGQLNVDDMSSSAYEAQVAATSPNSYYTFGDLAGSTSAYDSSGNNYTAQLAGTAKANVLTSIIGWTFGATPMLSSDPLTSLTLAPDANGNNSFVLPPPASMIPQASVTSVTLSALSGGSPYTATYQCVNNFSPGQSVYVSGVAAGSVSSGLAGPVTIATANSTSFTVSLTTWPMFATSTNVSSSWSVLSNILSVTATADGTGKWYYTFLVGIWTAFSPGTIYYMWGLPNSGYNGAMKCVSSSSAGGGTAVMEMSSGNPFTTNPGLYTNTIGSAIPSTQTSVTVMGWFETAATNTNFLYSYLNQLDQTSGVMPSAGFLSLKVTNTGQLEATAYLNTAHPFDIITPQVVNDGLPHMFVLRFSGYGTTTGTFSLEVDGTVIQTINQTVAYTLLPPTADMLFSTSLNQYMYYLSSSGATINLAQYATTAATVSNATTAAMHTLGREAFYIQYSGPRINTVLTNQGIPLEQMNLATGISPLQPTQSTLVGNTCLSYIETVNSTEQGYLWQDQRGIIQFKDRHYALNAGTPASTSQATFENAATSSNFYVVDNFTPGLDNLDLWNQVIASAQPGPTVGQYPIPSGTNQIYNDINSQAKYGKRTQSNLSGLLVLSDTEARNVAAWYGTLYGNPQPRIRSITTNSYISTASNSSVNNNVNLPQQLQRQLYDQITVIYHDPNGGSDFSQASLIEGIEHAWDVASIITTFRLAPAHLVNWFTLDDSSNGKLDNSILGY